MITFITILMILICVFLVLIVLIQNPKGGGLGASFGGLNNQVLGVKRTTDFLEKGTWTLAVVLLVFSLGSNLFIPKAKRGAPDAKTYKSEVAEGLAKQKTSAPPPQAPPPAAAPAATRETQK